MGLDVYRGSHSGCLYKNTNKVSKFNEFELTNTNFPQSIACYDVPSTRHLVAAYYYYGIRPLAGGVK